MNNDNRIVNIASIAVIVLLLFSTILLYSMKESEKDKRISLQKRVDELVIKEETLSAKLKEVQMSNAEMSANIKFQDEKISMLTKDLEDEKESGGKAAAKIQEKELEVQNLKSKIEEVRADKLAIQKMLDKLNEDYLSMKFNLENVIKTKDELEARAKELSEKEGVSLGTVIIKRPRD